MDCIGLFPGQGSQHVGMGKFLYENFEPAKHVFEEASDSISVDLKKLCFEGDEKVLALTENTQPALVTVSMAVWRVLNAECELPIKFLAGHSVGEYSALAASGVMSLAEAVSSVKKRGQLMQSAVPVGEGGMLAVLGLTEPQVLFLCEAVRKKTNAVLEPANFNSPGQIVISGASDAITYAVENTNKEMFGAEAPRRLKLIPLNVSAPFHCSMMLPAQEKLEEHLNSIAFKTPKKPIIQNVAAAPVSGVEEIKKNIIKQLASPVLWEQSLKSITDPAQYKFLELGSGKVLSGLTKKTLGAEINSFNFNTIDELKTFIETI